MSKSGAAETTIVQLTMSNCVSVDDYINRMTMTAAKVKRAGLKLDDEVIASLMLAGVPEEHQPLVMAIENSPNKLTMDSVKTLLLQEPRLNAELNVGDALYVKSKQRFKPHDVTKFRCHKCGRAGHFAKDCEEVVRNDASGFSSSHAAHSMRRNDFPLPPNRLAINSLTRKDPL